MDITIFHEYCKRGNYCVGVYFRDIAFFAKISPTQKFNSYDFIKEIGVVSWNFTPTWKVLATFLWNSPPPPSGNNHVYSTATWLQYSLTCLDNFWVLPVKIVAFRDSFALYNIHPSDCISCSLTEEYLQFYINVCNSLTCSKVCKIGIYYIPL